MVVTCVDLHLSSRHKKRPSKDQDPKDEAEPPGTSSDWIGEALLFIVGAYLIYKSGWNPLLIGIGTAFSLSPVLQIPAIRIYINRITGQQIFQIKQSQIAGSQFVGSAKEVHQELHYHEAPKTVPSPEEAAKPRAEPTEPDWEVDDEFTLTEDEDWHNFEFQLEDGEQLVGTVEADGHVSCYVCGVASFRSFQEDESFNPYWSREGVTKTKISFVAPGSRTYYFVVDLVEDEDVSVSVKLRVK